MANDDNPKPNNKSGSGGKGQSGGGAAKKKAAPANQASGAAKKSGSGQAKRPPNKGGTTRAQAAMARKDADKSKGRQTLLVWGTVGLVLIIVIVLVVVKATGSSNSGTGTNPATGGTPATTSLPASIAKEVTSIPASVFNTVGVTAKANQGFPTPTAVTGQEPLTYKNSAGVSLPGVFFLGAEFCPYCAAERWSLAAALSRFGTLTGLKATTSSCSDTDPCTQTLSFRSLKFESQYLVLRTIEQLTNQKDSSGNYTNLQPLAGADLALVEKYESTKYLGSGAEPDSFPFLNYGNQYLSAGPSYDPAVLKGQTRAEIASNLTDANNPATQAIVATANYMSAATCVITKDQPSAVCHSKGVEAANTSMGIK